MNEEKLTIRLIWMDLSFKPRREINYDSLGRSLLVPCRLLCSLSHTWRHVAHKKRHTTRVFTRRGPTETSNTRDHPRRGKRIPGLGHRIPRAAFVSLVHWTTGSRSSSVKERWTTTDSLRISALSGSNRQRSVEYAFLGDDVATPCFPLKID